MTDPCLKERFVFLFCFYGQTGGASESAAGRLSNGVPEEHVAQRPHVGPLLVVRRAPVAPFNILPVVDLGCCRGDLKQCLDHLPGVARVDTVVLSAQRRGIRVSSF